MENPKKNTPLGPAGWIALAALVGFLAVTAWYAVYAWSALAGVAITPAGWFFLILGVLFTLALGGGLMWLVFYSSRHDYDQ